MGILALERIEFHKHVPEGGLKNHQHVPVPQIKEQLLINLFLLRYCIPLQQMKSLDCKHNLSLPLLFLLTAIGMLILLEPMEGVLEIIMDIKE
jgi:hypothetical protein